MAANTRTPPEVRRLRAKAAAATRWGHPDAAVVHGEARAGLLAAEIRRQLARGLTSEQRTSLAALLLDADGGEHA